MTLPQTASYDVEALRATEFPWTRDVIYLDHASIGPLPERTRRAADAMNRRRSEPYGLGHEHLLGGLATARAAAAGLIGADPAEIALATNTSFGLGVAARALPLNAGDIVLVSQREFPANVYPWQRLGAQGVILELVPVTPAGWPDEARLLDRLADRRVRCLAVSLTQFATGYTVDLEVLSRVTRANGQFLVVDAIQALGQLPVDVRATPVDILASGGQKWLLSPWGSGFLYVRRDLIPRLDPAITGWMAFEGTDDFTRLTEYGDTLRQDARRFELITLPYQDFAGFTASLGLLAELGIPAIQAHLRQLQAPIVAWTEQRGIPLVSPTGAHGSGIVAVAPPALESAYRKLRAAQVHASQREGAIRLSPHCYNTLEEMERVAAILDTTL